MNNSVWDAVTIGRDSVLMQVSNDYFTGFHRNVLTSDSLWKPAATKEASESKVEASPDINILAKVTRYRLDGKMCVEAMLYLNQLNVYDIDCRHAMTICVGEDLDDVSHVESKWGLARTVTYETVSAWDFGFGALYSGSVWAKFGLKSKNSEIQFSDWNGAPVFWATLPIRALSFDINTANGMLYAIDVEVDEIVAFDATEILNAYREVSAIH